MSINEVRVVARIINQNYFLKEENKMLNSALVLNTQTIELLQANLKIEKSIVKELEFSIGNYKELDKTRTDEMERMKEMFKKDKRNSNLKFAGGGVLLGIILTLILI